MTVIDYEPSGWLLVRDGERLLLDVNCSHSSVSYGFSMELNEHEVQSYAAAGRKSLSELAEKIQYSAPGVISNVSPYLERRLQGVDLSRLDELTVAWVREHRNAL